MYEKLTKCRNFRTCVPKNARILHDNCPKNIFSLKFWQWGTCPPPNSCTYVGTWPNLNKSVSLLKRNQIYFFCCCWYKEIEKRLYVATATAVAIWQSCTGFIGVGGGGRGHVPLKIWEKIFFEQRSCKIREFCYLGKYHKNSGILCKI